MCFCDVFFSLLKATSLETQSSNQHGFMNSFYDASNQHRSLCDILCILSIHSWFADGAVVCLTLLQLVLNRVLMLGSQTQTVIGRPILPDASVHAVVEEHVRWTLISWTLFFVATTFSEFH
jgi:hypothetical protein